MNNGMTTAETARATAPVVMLNRATGQTAASKLPLLNTLNVTIWIVDLLSKYFIHLEYFLVNVFGFDNSRNTTADDQS